MKDDPIQAKSIKSKETQELPNINQPLLNEVDIEEFIQ